MANFCGNCGARLRKEDNFCGNCGAKIDKSDIKQPASSFQSFKDNIEKSKQKKLKIIDEIFESEEIKSEIRKNNSSEFVRNSIKNKLKKRLIDNNEKMSEEEIKDYIKEELLTIRILKEKVITYTPTKTKNPKGHGGYCNLSCIHYYEEILDPEGGVTADYTDYGGSEYYCNLGHILTDGRFCEDYE